MNSILCSGDGAEWLACIIIHPSSRQRLQNARRLTQGAPNPVHTLMEWINTAICTLWVNVGQPQHTGSKRCNYAALTQVVRNLGMRQSICNPNA